MAMKPYALQKDSDDQDFGSWSSFSPAHGEPADYCSRDGAQALKDKIEAYWRERGQNVMVALHNVGFHPAIRAARFDVRSDMVNGMPRVRGSAAKPQLQEVFAEDFDEVGDDLAFE
ncbi:hypothetical protein [Terricaulis silvestris]|nr:hypothetical protein [Terricaulis silvestris]